MNRIDPDLTAASRARPRPQTSTRAQEGAAPVTHPAPPPDQEGAAGQNSATLTSTTAEFQADGAP